MPSSENMQGYPSLDFSRVEHELNSEFQSLESGYQTRKSRRVEAWKRYRFEQYGNEVKGASTVTDSTIYNVVEWMTPSLIQPFVSTQDFIKVIPESARIRDVIAAEYNRELLNFQMRKRMDMYAVYYDLFKTALVGGDSYAKIVWVDRAPKLGEPVGRPKVVFTHPDSLRWDWTVKGGFYHSRVVTHEEDWTRSDCLGMYDQPGVDNRRLRSALENQGERISTARLRDEGSDSRNFIGEKSMAEDANKTTYTRREQWTEYDLTGDGKLEPVLAVFINDHLVQLLPNPYDFKKPPFVAVECVRDPVGNPPTGLANSLGDIQKFRTSILRMMSDNLNSQLNGMYEVDQTNVDAIGFQLLMSAPLGRRVGIPTRKMGSINPLPSNPMAPQAYQAWELLELAAENRGGFPRYAQGLNPSSLSQTATGVVETSQRSEMRLWELATRFGEGTLKPLVRMLIALNQQMLEPQDIEVQFGIDARGQVAYDSETGEEFPLDKGPKELLRIHREDIAGYFSVNLDIQIGSDKQNQINNMMQFAQYFAPYVGQALPPEVISVIATETARLMGMPKVEAIVRKGVYVGGGNTAIPIGAAQPTGAMGGPVQGAGADASLQGTDLSGVLGSVGQPQGPVA